MNNQTLNEQSVPPAVSRYLELNEHIEAGNVDRVRQWLSERQSLQDKERRPYSVRDPVCLAAERGEIQIFDLLVNNGFSSRSPDIGGPGYRRPALQPIHLAAKKGHLDLVKKLVEVHRADVNAEANQTTALHWAVTDRQLDVVNYLLRHKAEPLWSTSSCRNVKKRSPLVTAIRLCYWELVRAMIDNLHINEDFPLVSTLYHILQSERKDLAYLLYNKCPAGAVTLILNKEPHVPNLKVLHFLLEIHDGSLYNEQKCVLDRYLQLASNTGQFVLLKIMFEAGCPLSSGVGSSVLKNVNIYKGAYSEEALQCIKPYISSPHSLKALSTFRIRRHLGSVVPSKVDRLPLPTTLKRFLYLEHLKHYTEAPDTVPIVSFLDDKTFH